MNILSLNAKDIAGLSYSLCNSINELTPHKATSVIIRYGYTKYPYMLRAEGNEKKISKLVDEADVIHINERIGLLSNYNIDPSKCKGKKIIFHAHGGIFRKRKDKICRWLANLFPKAKLIVSTVNLLEGVLNGSWFPSIVPIEDYRREYGMRRNKQPVIYYSPTHPKRGLPELRKAESTLRKEGIKFKLKMTTRKRHTENLRLKSRADIYYDEIRSFYGVNAIEAAAFEMPVIYGITKYSRNYMKSHKVNCPFIAVDRGKNSLQVLKDSLHRLIKDKKYRLKLGKASYKYVKRMHSPEICVKRFLKLVE